MVFLTSEFRYTEKKMGQFDSDESSSCPRKCPHWGVKKLTNPKVGHWDSYAESV